MMFALIFITHLWNTDFKHWWDAYFFGGPGPAWYLRLVWGNVFAVLPLGLAGFVGYRVHKLATKGREDVDAKLERHHNEHLEHMRKILDALDPDTDGGLNDIKELLDVHSPGGIGDLPDELKTRLGSPGSVPQTP